jgi:hypothetical protein
MEVMGGIGFFSFLSYLSNLFFFTFRFGVKRVILLTFTLSLLFCMCAFSLLTLALKGLSILASLFLSQL